MRERGFVERLNESHESHMKRLSDTHREKVALLDRQFLQQKQQLMRAREAALWEMEERQLHKRGTSLPRPHQMSRQVRDELKHFLLAELLKCAFRILDPVQVVTSSGKGGGSQLWEDMKVSKLLGVPDLN